MSPPWDIEEYGVDLPDNDESQVRSCHSVCNEKLMIHF
jgi:hypothetical protein